MGENKSNSLADLLNLSPCDATHAGPSTYVRQKMGRLYLLVPVVTAVAGFALAKLSQRLSYKRVCHSAPANPDHPGSRGEQRRRPAAAAAGPALNLAALNEASPQGFYLADASLEVGASPEELADCFAVVDGTRLPLHSQVLRAQSAVLRDHFRSREEGITSAAVSVRHLPADWEAAPSAPCIILLALRQGSSVEGNAADC